MRPAMIVAGVLLAVAPVWGQTQENSDADTKRLLTKLLDDVSLYRCEGLFPSYLAFERSTSGAPRLLAWSFESEVTQYGDYYLGEAEGALYVISKSRVVEISEAGVKDYPCEHDGLNLGLLLSELQRKLEN